MNAALSALYFYQNPNTNKPSSSAVSVKQLCRIICPQKSSHIPLTSTSSNTIIGTRGIINPSTAVIGFDPIDNKYADEGWLMAKDVPILREACSTWYYEETNASKNTESESISSSSSSSSFKGPISCRELARIFYSGAGADGEPKEVDNDTRVWSSDLASAGFESEWKKICEVPSLRDAMEAFEDVVAVDFNNLVKQNEANKNQCEDENENTNVTHSTEKIVTETQPQHEKVENDLLEDFFSSTVDGEEDHHDEEEYESDGGTMYVKDPQSGEWKDSKQVEMRKAKFGFSSQNSKKRKGSSPIDVKSKHTEGEEDKTKKGDGIENITGLMKKKKKKPKFKAKNAKCWVYASGLPHDTDEEEVAIFFSKVGILDLDPESQKPKVKLYRYKNGDTVHEERKNMNGEVSMSVPARAGSVKGDASICFARAESVELAIQLLDDAPFRTFDSHGKFIDNGRISVQRAKFEQHGNTYHEQRRAVSNAKRKVARVAKLQAVGWDDGENGRITGGLKGLCIVVLKQIFDARKLLHMDEKKEDSYLKVVENKLRNECEKWGHVEKITVFSKNPEGVVIVKFTQPTAASKAIEYYNGLKRSIEDRKIEATFWDGVTDFTVRNEDKEKEEMNERLDTFGNWLDEQDLPDEFQLQVEGS